MIWDVCEDLKSERHLCRYAVMAIISARMCLCVCLQIPSSWLHFAEAMDLRKLLAEHVKVT